MNTVGSLLFASWNNFVTLSLVSRDKTIKTIKMIKMIKTILLVLLLYVTLRYSTLLYATLRYSTLLYATLRYSTLLYATLRYSTLLYATLSYSTLLYAILRRRARWHACGPHLPYDNTEDFVHSFAHTLKHNHGGWYTKGRVPHGKCFTKNGIWGTVTISNKG
jgi:hypothetical protein